MFPCSVFTCHFLEHRMERMLPSLIVLIAGKLLLLMNSFPDMLELVHL